MQEEPFHAEKGDGTPLCPNCLAEMLPTTQLCEQCGAPVGMFAMTDPYTAIFSGGWMVRKAVSTKVSTTSFIAFWLLLGMEFIGAAGVVYVLIFKPQVILNELLHYDIAEILSMSLGILLGTLHLIILYLITKSYIKNLRSKKGHCISCNYDLHGVTELNCPECATSFDPEDIVDDDREEEVKKE